MHIYGPAQLHGAQSVSAPHIQRVASRSDVGQAAPIRDELTLSSAADAADFVAQAKALPDIRQDRVNALRAQIASGAYETDEKISAALDRMLDEMG